MTARRAGLAALTAAFTLVGAGCIVAPPAPVTVVLANRTRADVTPKFFSSAQSTSPTALFVFDNRLVNFNDRAFDELRPGEVITLNFECEELLSMGVQRPVLFDAISLDVDQSEEEIFLVLDNGFRCGDLVRFVFDTNADGALTVDVEFE